MTDAEKRLLEFALRGVSEDALNEARFEVHRERLPEGYEANLMQLAEREAAARAASFEYSQKNPLGAYLLAEFRKQIRQRDSGGR